MMDIADEFRKLRELKNAHDSVVESYMSTLKYLKKTEEEIENKSIPVCCHAISCLEYNFKKEFGKRYKVSFNGITDKREQFKVSCLKEIVCNNLGFRGDSCREEVVFFDGKLLVRYFDISGDGEWKTKECELDITFEQLSGWINKMSEEIGIPIKIKEFDK